MFIAMKDGVRVHIDDVSRGEYTCYCQLCHNPVVIKKGEIIRHHFAHKPVEYSSGVSGRCEWEIKHDNNMSEWHINWQNKFPTDYQEKIITLGDTKKCADISFRNVVIEFQHTKIKREEFEKRNKFYTSAGYRLIWVFDFSDIFETKKIKPLPENDEIYLWHSGRWNCFFNFWNRKSENIDIYFETAPNTLRKVLWAESDFIRCALDKPFTDIEFINNIDKFQPQSIGKTLLDLWRDDYYEMEVTNLRTDQRFAIKDSPRQQILRSYSLVKGWAKDKARSFGTFGRIRESFLPIWKLNNFVTKEEYDKTQETIWQQKNIQTQEKEKANFVVKQTNLLKHGQSSQPVFEETTKKIVSDEKSLIARYLCAKRRLFDIYYEKLNDRQREAVFFADGNLLVLAGAGSGKTTVLVNRIVHLIRYGNAYSSPYAPVDLTEARVRELEAAASLSREQIAQILPEFISAPCAPWNMLAITFTNKAANEIKSRLCEAMGDPDAAKDVWAGTFHSICMRILRVYAERLGYAPGFTIYDTDDQKSLMSDIMKKKQVDTKTLSVKAVLSEIGRAKDNLLDADDYEKEYAVRDIRHRAIAALYREYQTRLREANAMDFDDIIMLTVRLLETDAEARARYQNKFRYVCVDEFQDTNIAQFRLTALFAGGYHNLMVVGDDDQSIYKFRGAVIDNILGFDRRFANTKVIKLEQNYRSTSVILEAANGVIAKNLGRHGKELWTDRSGGEKLTLRTCEEVASESRYLSERIQALVADGTYAYRDMAVLYRMNMQSRAIEQTFVRSGIPYRMLGGLRFNDRKEIRDIVAYLQLIINPADRERFRRVINEPKRGLGQKTVDAVVEIAAEQACPVLHVLRDADRYAALGRSVEKLKSFYRLMRSLRDLLDTDISLENFVEQVLERTGYRQMLIDGGEEEKERLENLDEFVSGVIEYEKNAEQPTLVGFLEENALVAEVDKYDESADAVVMMTIHSAKGLEFPVVFLPGMEDGVFPGMQNITSGATEDMEEERRLAYVALTRAKDRIFITHAKTRMMNGRTAQNPISRFVTEIPSHLIFEDAPRTYESRYAPQRPRVYIADGKPMAPLFSETPAPKKTAASLNLKEGDRVSHAVFGAGEILSARPMGADVLYEVIFDRVGTKKLMGTYARLKKLS